jgi:hypothetical protein
MKLGPTKVFQATIAPRLMSRQFVIDQIVPTSGSVVAPIKPPLGSNTLYLSRSNKPVFDGAQASFAAPAPGGSSPAAAIGQLTPPPTPFDSLTGFGVAGTSLTLIPITQAMTHAQLTGYITAGGVPAYWASDKADVALKAFNQNQQAPHVLIGVATSGVTYVLIGWFRPNTSRNLKLSLAGLAGLAVLGLLAWLGSTPNPFAGTWVEDVAQSRYARALSPRVATLTITEERDGLKVKDDAVLADGQQRHLTYLLNPDGLEHPDPTAKADTVVVTRKNDTLEAVFHKAGVVVTDEKAELSADEKEMTLTMTDHSPGGGEIIDVVQYDRK